MDEIESERWKRERRQVTTDGGPRPWTGRETLDRYAYTDAGEGKDAASAIRYVVVDLDERSNRSPRERDRPKRRDRRIDVAGR